MSRKRVGFIKGNMGGNQVLLLDGRKIPEDRELEKALDALEPLRLGGHQAGVLYEGEKENEIEAKIVTITGQTYISMCGGLTQILGKALVEDSFLDDFNLVVSEPETEITLRTDSGPVVITVEVEGGHVLKTRTSMNSFVDECYEIGVRPIITAGVNSYKVGDAHCVEVDEVCEEYPKADLENIDEPTLKILRRIQRDYLDQFYPDSSGMTFSVYDRNPRRNGDVRVIFPHQVVTGHIEPSCGTGTTVIGLAMVEKGQLPSNETTTLVAESGGGTDCLGGPEKTTLDLEIGSGRVKSASFSHSLVEILATGNLWL